MRLLVLVAVVAALLAVVLGGAPARAADSGRAARRAVLQPEDAAEARFAEEDPTPVKTQAEAGAAQQQQQQQQQQQAAAKEGGAKGDGEAAAQKQNSTQVDPESLRCAKDCSENGYCMAGKCLCRPGFKGPACDETFCPRGCNGRGHCNTTNAFAHECVCNPGWYGADCSIHGCPSNCHNHGFCVEGVCQCFGAYSGLYCEATIGCEDDCHGNGVCVNGRCFCEKGHAGKSCEERLCPNDCSGNGMCDPHSGQCTCEWHWLGDDCSKRACPNDCSGHGYCNEATGECLCHVGFYGEDCSPQNCPSGCSGHGTCVQNDTHGYCDCKLGYAGEACEQEVCPDDCGGSDHGNCTRTGCACTSDWTGKSCDTRRCPDDCNGAKQGICNPVTHECNCLMGWTGTSCSLRACPYDCNYHGVCKEGVCSCRDWWGGKYCDQPTCLNDCNANGVCVKGHVAPDSAASLLGRAVTEATGATGGGAKPSAKLELQKALADAAGKQSADKPSVPAAAYCECSPGWGGPACGERLCPDSCNNRGLCRNGECFCKPGFYGHSCAISHGGVEPTKTGSSSPSDGGHENVSPAEAHLEQCQASCVHGKCLLVPKYDLEDGGAHGKLSKADMSNNEIEEAYSCFCEPHWGGAKCDQSLAVCADECKDEAGLCLPDCNGSVSCPVFAGNGLLCGGPSRGVCGDDKSTCHCKEGYFGDACDLEPCKNDCSNHGYCNNKLGKCICFASWAGDDCSQEVHDD